METTVFKDISSKSRDDCRMVHLIVDNEVSLYDDPLGSLVIDDLTPGVIYQDIYTKRHRTYGQKNNMLKALQCLWGYANRKNLMGDNPPLDPTRRQYGGVDYC